LIFEFIVSPFFCKCQFFLQMGYSFNMKLIIESEEKWMGGLLRISHTSYVKYVSCDDPTSNKYVVRHRRVSHDSKKVNDTKIFFPVDIDGSTLLQSILLFHNQKKENGGVTFKFEMKGLDFQFPQYNNVKTITRSLGKVIAQSWINLMPFYELKEHHYTTTAGIKVCYKKKNGLQDHFHIFGQRRYETYRSDLWFVFPGSTQYVRFQAISEASLKDIDAIIDMMSELNGHRTILLDGHKSFEISSDSDEKDIDALKLLFHQCLLAYKSPQLHV